MPLYTFKCPNCGFVDRAFRKIAERNRAPLCVKCTPVEACRSPMHRIIEAPAVHDDLPGYQSPINGQWIEGRRARHEDLRRNHCRPWEGMAAEKQEAHRRAAEIDRAYDKAVEGAIVDTYKSLSPDKQRALDGLPA